MTTAAATTRLTVNGATAEVAGDDGRRLLDVLRGDLGLTGTKEGCGEGECGACSILLDGAVVNSCLVPLCQAAGRDVVTVEGLAADDRLHPLQSAILETGGVQCGICTPGFLLAGAAFLASGEAPTEDAVRRAIAGNLCRCTGYVRIVDAVRLAAKDPAAARRARTAAPAGRRAGGIARPGGAGMPSVTRPDTLAIRSPRTLDDALRLLAGGGRRPIAGGTDVMVGLGAGATAPPLLDLSGLDALRGIRVQPVGDGEALVLGALTTYAEMRRSPAIAAHMPVLAEAAAGVGAAQIQGRGTIGGNVVNASPAGDMLPILLATDATILLRSLHGARSVPAGSFWTAYRTTALAPDELVVGVRIPLRDGREVRFRKVGGRRALAIGKVIVAAAFRLDDGRWRDVRVAAGSVAPTPIRATATEAILEGAPATPETIERAAVRIAAEISPIDDVRSTAVYRREVAGRVLRRMLLDAIGE
jgi:carbon-monoxide dehydrogenase small subunit/xanthine dehydrogenase small subunit